MNLENKNIDPDALMLITGYIKDIEEYLQNNLSSNSADISSILSEINDFVHIRCRELATNSKVKYDDVLKAIAECGSPSEICESFISIGSIELREPIIESFNEPTHKNPDDIITEIDQQSVQDSGVSHETIEYVGNDKNIPWLREWRIFSLFLYSAFIMIFIASYVFEIDYYHSRIPFDQNYVFNLREKTFIQLQSMISFSLFLFIWEGYLWFKIKKPLTIDLAHQKQIKQDNFAVISMVRFWLFVSFIKITLFSVDDLIIYSFILNTIFWLLFEYMLKTNFYSQYIFPIIPKIGKSLTKASDDKIFVLNYLKSRIFIFSSNIVHRKLFYFVYLTTIVLCYGNLFTYPSTFVIMLFIILTSSVLIFSYYLAMQDLLIEFIDDQKVITLVSNGIRLLGFKMLFFSYLILPYTDYSSLSNITPIIIIFLLLLNEFTFDTWIFIKGSKFIGNLLIEFPFREDKPSPNKVMKSYQRSTIPSTPHIINPQHPQTHLKSTVSVPQNEKTDIISQDGKQNVSIKSQQPLNIEKKSPSLIKRIIKFPFTITYKTIKLSLEFIRVSSIVASLFLLSMFEISLIAIAIGHSIGYSEWFRDIGFSEWPIMAAIIVQLIICTFFEYVLSEQEKPVGILRRVFRGLNQILIILDYILILFTQYIYYNYTSSGFLFMILVLTSVVIVYELILYWSYKHKKKPQYHIDSVLTSPNQNQPIV